MLEFNWINLRTVCIAVFAWLGILLILRVTAARRWPNLFPTTRERLFYWIILAGITSLALAFGRVPLLVGVLAGSFLALREFFTVIPSRRADRAAIFLSYFSIPFTLYFIYIDWYNMFVLTVPIYVFLLLPIVLAIQKDRTGMVASLGRIGFGLLLLLYCLSHIGYLYILNTHWFVSVILLTEIADQTQVSFTNLSRQPVPSAWRSLGMRKNKWGVLASIGITLGLGGASTGLADGPGTVFSNPAGMVFLKSMQFQGGGLTGEGSRNPIHLTFASPHPSRTKAWGLHLSQLSIKSDVFDLNGQKAGTAKDTSLAGGLSYARALGSHQAWGLTASYVSQKLKGATSIGLENTDAKVFAGTFGYMFSAPADRWRAGLVAYNWGPGAKFKGSGGAGDAGVALPSGIRLGGVYRMEVAEKNLNLVLDYDHAKYVKGASLNFGSEYWMVPLLAVRGGVSLAKRKGSGISYIPSIGMGFQWTRMVLDLGFNLDTDGPGNLIAANIAWKFKPKDPPKDPPKTVKSPPLEKSPQQARVPKRKRVTVALADFDALYVTEGEAKEMSTFVRSYLRKTGGVRLMNVKKMDKMLSEFDYAHAGCTEKDCALKIGEMLQVEKMIVGEFSYAEGTYEITAKVFDVKKSRIRGSQSVKIDSEQDFKLAAKRLATRLAPFLFKRR